MSRFGLKNQERHKLRYYCLMLAKNKPFAVSRYGDGEWKAILFGMRGGEPNGYNADLCKYTKYVSGELRRALRYQFDLPFEYNMLNIGRKMKKDIVPFMRKTRLDIRWVRGDIMLNANLEGKLFPMIRQLKKKRVLYVGPSHCRGLKSIGMMNLRGFVEVPVRDAINDKKRIINEILKKIKDLNIDVVGFSSGFASNVFVADVWHLTKKRVTLIDFGSLWDGYFGKLSRSYIIDGRVDWKGLLAVNTGKRKARHRETFRF